MAQIMFKFGPRAKYLALGTYDTNTLYFITDTKEIYKGADLFTESVRFVTARPANPAQGVVYVNTTTGAVEAYNGTEWKSIINVVTTLTADNTDAQLPSAKAVYTEFAALKAQLGQGNVADQITNAITALDLANTYETKTDATNKLAEAKKYTEDTVAPVATAVEKAQGDATQALADAATANAGVTEAKAAAAQALVDAKEYVDPKFTSATNAINAVDKKVDDLDSFVGDIPEGYTETTVIDYINKVAEETLASATGGSSESAASVLKALNDHIAEAVETYATKDELTEAVEGINGTISSLGETYATKDELAGEKERAEGKEAELATEIAKKANQTDLEAVSNVANAAAKQTDLEAEVTRATGEEARIEGLVTAEVTRATGEEARIEGLVTAEVTRATEAEAALDERLVEVETFFKTAEGETIDQALDTLVEIQKYITEDGTAADEMVKSIEANAKAIEDNAKDIEANAKAIEDHLATDHDFASADATLKQELVAEIGKKADATVVEAIDDRLEVVEGKVATLEGIDHSVYAVKTEVATDIATAKGEAIDAAAADATSKANAAQAAAEATAAADATSKANAAQAAAEVTAAADATSKANAAQAAAEATAAADATSKANAAEANAKAYVDTALTWAEF